MKGVTGRPNLTGTVPVSLGDGKSVGSVSIDDVWRDVNSDAERKRAHDALVARARQCPDSTEATEVLRQFWLLFKPRADAVVARLDTNFYVPAREQARLDSWARAKWPALATQRQRYINAPVAGADPGVTWNDLRDTGRQREFRPQDYKERNADRLWDLLRSNVVPEVLGGLVEAARRLRLKDGYSGMAFHVSKANVQGSQVVVGTSVYNVRDSQNKSSSDCYESRNLPVNMGDGWNGHIIVHQSKTPCMHCCNGYRQWAIRRGCTIVVAVTDAAGYDGLPPNATFIFAHTGNAVCWS